MSQVTNDKSDDGKARGKSCAVVQHWRIDATSLNVAIHLHADGVPTGAVPTASRGFVLDAEQARQMIRDLSAAVLALDLLRHVEQAVGSGDRLQCVDTVCTADEVLDMTAGTRLIPQ